MLGEEQSETDFDLGAQQQNNVLKVSEKMRTFNLQSHAAFTDFEKVFDQVNGNKLWSITERRRYKQHSVNIAKNLYRNFRRG